MVSENSSPGGVAVRDGGVDNLGPYLLIRVLHTTSPRFVGLWIWSCPSLSTLVLCQAAAA